MNGSVISCIVLGLWLFSLGKKMSKTRWVRNWIVYLIGKIMVDMRFAYDIFTIPPKINMPPEEGPFQKEMNHLPNTNFHGIC